MSRKKQKNYLDLIPERAEEISWEEKEGSIILRVENTGIDGEKTVMELAKLQKEAFGDEVEPLYPRIVKYFQIVESYHFIRFKN